MACPTCDRTMQSLSERFFWCPCCGTLKRVRAAAHHDDVCSHEIPKAVTALIDCAKAVEDYNKMMDAQEAAGRPLSVEGFSAWRQAQATMKFRSEIALSYFRPVIAPETPPCPTSA